MKKLISIISTILCIAIISCTQTVLANTASLQKGDVNEDGTVSVVDATTIQKYLVNFINLSDRQKEVADLNNDNKISILDATYLQRYLINKDETATEVSTTEPSTIPRTEPTTEPETEPTTAPVAKPNEMELEIFNIINQCRAEAGVHPLEFGYFYYDCARVRAEEGNRFFSHTRPNGTSWQTVLQEYGIDCTIRYTGENIAQFYPDAESVMEAFMGSPGHKANILREEYDYAAIAVYESEEYPGNYTIVQLFASKVVRH